MSEPLSDLVMLSSGAVMNLYLHTDCPDPSISLSAYGKGHVVSARFSITIAEAQELHGKLGKMLDLVPQQPTE